MKIAIYSTEGTGLCFWKRLQDEGHEVKVFIGHKAQSQVGDGIVSKASSYTELAVWGRGGLYFFDCSGEGEKAEALRRSGQKVVGGGAFCDKLENERDWAVKLIESTGVKSPPTHSFATISQARAFAKAHPKHYYFKSNKYLEAACTFNGEGDALELNLAWVQEKWGDRIPCILQEQMEGFALSTARWWNGHNWTGPYEGTIEHKKFMDNDKGGSTGCSFNMVWFYTSETPYIAERLQFEKLGQLMAKNNAPPGLYDINAILSTEDGEPYFLEFTPRMGFDSEPTSQKGIFDFGKLLSTLASGGDISHLFNVGPVYCSVRLSVSPYPYEHIDGIPPNRLPLGKPILGVDGLWARHFIAYGVKHTPKGLVVADPTGLVGLASAAGKDPDECFAEIYKFIDTLNIKDLQYRTDAAEKVKRDLRTIVTLGYQTYR